MGESFVPINISDKAITEVKSIMEKKGIPVDYGLRVGIKGAGCAGISYLIGFDKRKESDVAFVRDGVEVFVEKKHVMYLVGIELDFYEDVDTKGFTFTSSKELDELES